MNKGHLVVWFTMFVGVLIIIFFLFEWLAPVHWKYPTKFAEATSMINEIEKFKSKEGRYPNNSSEIGIPEKISGPYYTLNKDNTYIVSFPGGSCFFCAQNYYSSTKAWVEHE